MRPAPHLVHFAQRLRVAMAAAEVTPRQLARECGVSPQAVYKWMRGLCAMRAQHLMVICKMTGANLDWLMTMEPVPLRADPPVRPDPPDGE